MERRLGGLENDRGLDSACHQQILNSDALISGNHLHGQDRHARQFLRHSSSIPTGGDFPRKLPLVAIRAGRTYT